MYWRDNLFPSLWRNSGSVKIFLSTFFTYSCYLNSKPGCILQSFTTYLRQTLLSIWKSALRVKFSFYFSGDFCKYWQNFYFGSRSKHQTTRSFWDFSDVSLFSKTLDLHRSATHKATSIYQFVSNKTFRFICGKWKICSTIKNSQNIINIIVWKLFFRLLRLY